MWIKRTVLSLVVFITFPLTARHLEPQEVTFLFDIHDVFLQKKLSKVGSALWKHKYSIFNLPVITTIARMGWSHMTEKEVTSEEFIRAAIKQKSPGWAQLIKDIANAQEPIEGTVAIIRELHDHGYRLHIGSNIGIQSFTDLNNKQKNPVIANIFSNFDIPRSQISVNTATGAIKKPQLRFFKRYLSKNNNPDPQTIIFIDDLEPNIQAAKKLGFETIHYKNPEQLKKELINRGFTFLKKTKPISITH